MKVRYKFTSANAADITIRTELSDGAFTPAHAEWDRYPPSEMDLIEYEAVVRKLMEQAAGHKLKAREIEPGLVEYICLDSPDGDGHYDKPVL